jgi:hypothetical protein
LTVDRAERPTGFGDRVLSGTTRLDLDDEPAPAGSGCCAWNDLRITRACSDLANGIIAKRIIELAKAGERNPDLLCEGALRKLREHLYGD